MKLERLFEQVLKESDYEDWDDDDDDDSETYTVTGQVLWLNKEPVGISCQEAVKKIKRLQRYGENPKDSVHQDFIQMDKLYEGWESNVGRGKCFSGEKGHWCSIGGEFDSDINNEKPIFDISAPIKTVTVRYGEEDVEILSIN
jgi:hypothetical protein